jgi:hypothetical protein
MCSLSYSPNTSNWKKGSRTFGSKNSLEIKVTVRDRAPKNAINRVWRKNFRLDGLYCRAILYTRIVKVDYSHYFNRQRTDKNVNKCFTKYMRVWRSLIKVRVSRLTLYFTISPIALVQRVRKKSIVGHKDRDLFVEKMILQLTWSCRYKSITICCWPSWNKFFGIIFHWKWKIIAWTTVDIHLVQV